MLSYKLVFIPACLVGALFPTNHLPFVPLPSISLSFLSLEITFTFTTVAQHNITSWFLLHINATVASTMGGNGNRSHTVSRLYENYTIQNVDGRKKAQGSARVRIGRVGEGLLRLHHWRIMKMMTILTCNYNLYY